VLDEDGGFPGKYNPELVSLERVESWEDESLLRGLIEEHSDKTGSAWGRHILAHWSEFQPKFWKIVPISVPMDIMGHTVHQQDDHKEAEKEKSPAKR